MKHGRGGGTGGTALLPVIALQVVARCRNSLPTTTPLTNADSLIRSSCVTQLRQVLALHLESHPSCSQWRGDTREGTSGGKTDGMREEGGREWIGRKRGELKKVKERVDKGWTER